MDIKQKLKEYEDLLVKAERHTPLSKDWRNNFPKEGGVYVLWENGSPVYVGETSGLWSRMGDLSRPVNHPFPAKVAIILALHEAPIKELRAAIERRYKLSYVVVPFGRAEVEEYLILRWRNTLINKPTKRLLNGVQYDWVEVA